VAEQELRINYRSIAIIYCYYYFGSRRLDIVMTWRMRKAGNAAPISERKNSYKILNTEGKRLFGRPRRRWNESTIQTWNLKIK
jgi:hypothetical protein